MYAIIQESGGQRRVREGDVILVDLLAGGAAVPGQVVTFERVLMLGDTPQGAVIGRPYVPGASVTGEVVEPVTVGPKLHIHKFRPKKTYKRKTGHRQRYTRVRITAIRAS